MGILVDTNILLRRTQPDHPHHVLTVESIAYLLDTGEPVYFTLQNAAEFWNVATRPADKNGLGFSNALVRSEWEKIEQFLTLLPDSPAMYGEWIRLVVKHGVQGVQVHDARLVAAMNIHGVSKILTFNVEDFTRYQIEPLHPSALLS